MSRGIRLGLMAFVGASLLVGCCPILQQQAAALVEEFAACETDEQCVRFDYLDDGSSEQSGVGNSCVSQFQCSEALNGDLDLDEFTRRAVEISERYGSQCPVCNMASCTQPGAPLCNQQTGMCQFGASMSDAGLAVSPLVVDFGSVIPGASAEAEISVSNAGTDTLFLDVIILSGDDVFRFDDESMDKVLAPDMHTALPVFCEPAIEGAFEGTLDLESNGGHTGVSLSCVASADPQPSSI